MGLFQVFQLGLQGIHAHVIDALPHAGGQCAELYADKPIYDIPGIPVCTGQELAALLLQQIQPFSPAWHLGTQVASVAELEGSGLPAASTERRLRVQCANGVVLHTRTVFIAAGVGAFVPRTLKLEGIEAFQGRQLHYQRLPSTLDLTGQTLVVHGGDEDAVAQVVALAQGGDTRRPGRIVLLHRRDVFQAPEALLGQLAQLRERGAVDVVAAQITGFDSEAGRLTALTLMDPEGLPSRLPLDQLLVVLGISPRLGPIADWGLAMERKQLAVDTASFQTNVPGIYAVGDIVTYPGKRKLILCGFHEATLAAFAAAEALSGEKVALQYTTTSPRLQQRLGVLG